MDSFLLVDLQVQRDAVAEHIKGWEVKQVIDWMCQYGTVNETVSRYGKIFIFKSPAGMKTGFYFTPAGRLMVIASGWLPV
jgi:hypothetical protein